MSSSKVRLRGTFEGAAVVAAIVTASTLASASPPSGAPAGCTGRVTASAVVACALWASLAVQSERDGLGVLEGRRLAVSPLLPSNPTVSLSAARRSTPTDRATNWAASLSQELEIAGQRGLRRDAAGAAVEAQRERIVTTQRDVAAEALLAFYDALAARDELALATRLVDATDAVARAAHARLEQGLLAAVDADVADAVRVRALRARFAAERAEAGTLTRLSHLLGATGAAGATGPAASPLPRVSVDGDLAPLPTLTPAGSTARAAAEARPELRALDAERRASSLRAAAFRRSRVPNPTVSAFIQNDGFDERVLGLGLTLPVPLPGNVGRTYDGEIAAAEAEARRASTERERARRGLSVATEVAAQDHASRAAEVQAFTPELLSNAARSLGALGEEVQHGRLTVREAVVAQQALIELLQGHVAARRAWCRAAVELARASGVALERRAP